MDQAQQSNPIQPNNLNFYFLWYFLAFFPLFLWAIDLVVVIIEHASSGMFYFGKIMIELPVLLVWELIFNIVMISIRKIKKIGPSIKENYKTIMIALVSAIFFVFLSLFI